MTNGSLPPGWYEDEQGASRYWDGTMWLRPAAPSGAPEGPPQKAPRGRRWLPLFVGLGVVLAAFGTGGYFVAADRADREAQAAASAEALDRAEREAEATRLAAAEEAAAKQCEESARAEAERLELENRREYVDQLEEHVLKTAKERHKDGLYSERVLSASCMPVTGSAIEALDETSTSFSCLAVTRENKDGTHSGYEIEGLINWNTGEMTWG
ncbi:DUF2510 domain-containing protein [Sanguibacter sp. HDW7]|uniref:DUF2510 domain-containing protein n=1 Tax=Sanguibacter sp. HDW7 TaxID=2714931 RepID=UPI00140AA2AD|nr:DUF2510 domain-containing protein [Sanguibacter sp. HDW7]QIK83180.1 DUF2510 domain-containing protein [Sanguibacter sp. HDW7]